MATSLLRLGRLGPFKHLQVGGWGVLRSSAAPLCTQAEGTPKRTKAASKTAEAPDDRAALLAYKTAVAFPVRFSQPPSVGAAEPVATAAAAAATPAAVASETAGAPAASSHPAANPDISQVIADTPPPVADAAAPESLADATTEMAATELSGPAADGSSSSSSSDSDSDSDSDSEDEDEDEKSEVKTETKTSAPEVAESSVKVEAGLHEVTSEAKKHSGEDKKEAPLEHEGSPGSAAEAAEEMASAAAAAAAAAQAPVETPSASPEELVNSAPEMCSGTEDTLELPVTSTTVSVEAAGKPAPEVIKDVASPAVPEALTEDVTEAATATGAPVETTEPASAPAAPAAPAAPEDVAAEPVGDEVAPVDEAAETAAEVLAPAESAEELVDLAPAVAEAAGEELQVEATVEPSEEAAAAAPPEPEEPFDNSTYKNYQHHSYNPYTFADLDVEMAKFRLPQPSSGRPSPRH